MSIKIENVVLPSDLQWKSIIMGTRNPMNSWDKSDSTPDAIGEKDLKLLSGLAKAGPDHGKFLRMIPVYIDITAPLYWWKEFDTYKIGTVANSCSTMHKIHDKEFTLDDFSHEHLSRYVYDTGSDIAPVFDSERYLEFIVEWLNLARDLYLKTKDKKWWWQIIQLLPSSYNQKRTVLLNYQVIKHMYHSRKEHKLDEWRIFCSWCEQLPYFKELCLQKGE